jgi:hypothetical protein
MGDKYLNIQESLLKDINKDLLFANDNLKTSSKGIINQGNQIIKIQNKIEKSGDNIYKINNRMLIIERRGKLYKFTLYLIIILEFLTIILLLFRKIFK